jgi:two-component system cell cycle response regulator DivK
MNNDLCFVYVEDDAQSREVLRFILQRIMRYQHVYLFESSQDFMERVRNLPVKPTLFFLDLRVRPLDGFEMLQLLRADPEYQQTLVVALTANVMATDVKMMQEAGFNGLISKPIDKNIFPTLISQLLAGDSVWYVS